LEKRKKGNYASKSWAKEEEILYDGRSEFSYAIFDIL
jgi:hypothetical protein